MATKDDIARLDNKIDRVDAKVDRFDSRPCKKSAKFSNGLS
jgi:hypothetical protein